jgi:hypothetical protein
MLHLLYITAFTILAGLAITNLVRNLFTLGMEAQRFYPPEPKNTELSPSRPFKTISHPEMLDDTGKVINEPLLVMRSMTVEDAREQLDALFEASPGYEGETRDEQG